MTAELLIVRQLGHQDYLVTWQAMRVFTDSRTEDSADEIWLLEHNPVFTQGQNGRPEHILQLSDIPLVQTDRGGQITYHGPGQLMMYTLIDLKRKKINIRDYVRKLEQSVIDLLAAYQVEALAKLNAPGVYVGDKKICSIGLRIRKGYAYHGIALNVTTDLAPFQYINPCGFQGLQMTSLTMLGITCSINEVGEKLSNYFIKNLSYTSASWV